MSNNSFLNKILLLLEKTRDALIEDLKKEFVSVRTAWDDALKANAYNEKDFSFTDDFNKKVKIIDAVFAKVGYDISHYESLSNLKDRMLSMLTTVDSLTGDVKQLTEAYQNNNSPDVKKAAKSLDSAVSHIQTLLTLVKEIADIEWDKVANELYGTGNNMVENIKEQFLSKEFARKVLDHIIITLLKNAKDVFHDEIKHARLAISDNMDYLEKTAIDFEKQIKKDIANKNETIEAQVNALLRETFDEYTDIKNRIEKEIKKAKEENLPTIIDYIRQAGKDFGNSNIYVKISRAMSITYSILDFLGVMREVRVTLRLPSGLQTLISSAQGLVSNTQYGLESAIGELSKTISENAISATTNMEALQANVVNGLQTAAYNVASATKDVTDAMDQNLQITKEVTGLSAAALGAMQTQLLSLYGPDGSGGILGDGVNSINSTLNSLSSQLIGTCANVNENIGDKCKTINETLETVKNISYPVTIVTISWSSVESLFTMPISHFKNLFPINNVDDIENLMRRLMGIMHCINPDIPDFDSISNMLESLLKRLQAKVIMLINEAKEEANVIWDKFQPIIATIRKVIDMLKEMALALKDRMYGVLNDVKGEISEVMNGAKQLLSELQDQIKKQAGIILDEEGELVDEAGNKIKDAGNTLEGKLYSVLGDIDKANKKIVTDAVNELNKLPSNGSGQSQGTIYEVQEGFDSLTETVQKWVKEQRESIAKINIPRIVNQTIAEPLINCASGILKDTLDLDKVPDFASVFDLMHDIVSLKSLLAQQFELQPATVTNNMEEPPKFNFSFSTVTGTQNAISKALEDIKGVVNSVNVLNTPKIDVEKIVLPPLQAWAYSVAASMKTVMEPMVWKTRMDNLITQLQAEFQNDLQNITSLISKDGVNRLISDAGAVKDQLKNNLQINDYVTIVQTALNDVVLPNPELYFSSLKITLTNIVSQLAAAFIDSYNTLKGKLKDKVSEILTIANNLGDALKKLKDDEVKKALEQMDGWQKWANDMNDMKEKAVDEALKRFNTVKDAVLNIVERIKDLVASVNAFINEKQDKLTKENFNNHLEELKASLKNRLEDLALEIWGNLKAEVITPVLTTIKDEIIQHIRKLVKTAIRQLTDALTQVGEVEGELAKALNKVPGLKELKEAIDELAKKVENVIRNDSTVKGALNGIVGFDPNDPKITDLKQLPVIFKHLEKANFTIPKDFKLNFIPNVDAVIKNLKESEDYLKQSIENRQKWLLDEIEKKKNDLPKVSIPADYICWTQSLLQATIDFVQSDMAAVDILNLAIAVYKGIPTSVKDDISDLMPELPELPDNTFTQILKKVSCNYDLDNKFCNLTLLNLKGENNSSSTSTEANMWVQVFAFVGTYNPEEENEEVKVIVSDGNTNVGQNKSETKEDKSKPALYIMFYLRGDLKFSISTENHKFDLNLQAAAGQQFGGEGEGNNETSKQSLGFCLTKKTDDDPRYFHSWADLGSLKGLLEVGLQRKNNANPVKLLNTKYLDLNIVDYPQRAYLLYNSNYPEEVATLLNLNDDEKKVSGFTAGYMAQLEDVEIILKLRQNDFFKSILNDDISAKFTVSLLYDYLKGFEFGGGYSFHLDYDCSNLKLGKLQLQNLSIDIGSLKNDWGTLQLSVGSTFNINLDAVAFSFENLGVSLNLNVVKPDFSLGNWDVGCKFNFPTGIGITVDTTAVKGSGLISYEEDKGELLGFFGLKIINKFDVTTLFLADLGTVEGHFFSFMGLLSFNFTPGFPLGMGFSLTGFGGCLGLERMIDRKAIITSVQQGTLGSIFFGKDVMEHQAEMKSAALALFPAKRDQFFLGLLGQISYEPVLTCDFGLILQFPDPTEIFIVGALKVAIEDLDVIRINVQFAGDINFEEGMFFYASIIDSQIVGLKLEGSMAFCLNWGGANKGFLLSIGGFHPNYKPESGMLINVSDMKRTAMKLDYDILKISLESYLAITSNTFQIGADLHIQIGWKKFGLVGHAGFDALFQFDPFMFMFDAVCCVAVKCGNSTLMSIDLSFSLFGPRPWHVSGKASIDFLFDIDVNFNLEWGGKQPKLPDKQIELKPLFIEQINNNNNWTINEEAQADDDVEVNMKHKEGELLVQPFGTIHFNQAAIPLQLERTMDLCNNAVPTDYNDLTVTSFTLSKGKFKETLKKDDTDNLTNDFAPALFYNLSNQEKLSMPSYKKYVSGFALSVSKGADMGECRDGVKAKDYYKKGKEKPENLKDITFSASPTGTLKAKSDPLAGGKKNARKASYPLKTKNAFARYIMTLDSINENN